MRISPFGHYLSDRHPVNMQIRPAKPEDVQAAVPLIYSSGPPTFDYVFAHKSKGSACDFLAMAFLDGRGEFGFQHHVVVEKNGRVLAIGTAFSGQEMPGFTVNNARQIIKYYGLIAGFKIMRQGLQVEKVVQPPKGKLHYIAHLGVVPELRSQGIGTHLIEWLMEEGRQKGRTVTGLDVSVDNPQAQALYERLGFVVKEERISTLKNEHSAVANHRYLERPL